MRPIGTLVALCVATAIASGHGMWPRRSDRSLQPANEEAAEEQELEGLKLLRSIPDCGLECLQTVIVASPCQLTDHACSCGNKTIAREVQTCVLAACTVREALATKNITSTICHRPVRDRGSVVSGTAVGGLVFAIMAYLTRVVSKLHMRWGSAIFFSDLWWDDLAMTLAMAVDIPFMMTSVKLATMGYGRDIWTINPDHLTPMLKILFFNEIFYLLGLVLVKMTMLLTYLRFFFDPPFRKVVFGVMAANLLTLVSFVVSLVFQCTPVEYAWTRWDGLHEGRCIPFYKMAYPAAAINIVLDIIVIVLPFPQLWKMRMNGRKKLQVMIMFGTGLVITVLSILRLQSLVAYTDHNNFTWVYVTTGGWSKLELNCSIICACMPAIRNCIRRFGPSESTVGGSTATKSGLSSGKCGSRRNDDGDVDHHLGTLTVSDPGKSVDLDNFVELKERNTVKPPNGPGKSATAGTTETRQGDD